MMRKSIALLVILGLSSLIGCGSGGDASPVTSTTPPVAPSSLSITTHPQSKTIVEGSSVALSVVATGNAPIHYQWYRGATPVGSDNATYTITTAQAIDAGSYTVRVSNSSGTVTSNPAALTITSLGTGREWPSNYGNAVVCTWKDDKIAAFSFTIDDNPMQDIPWWRSMASQYGFKFTWFIITGALSSGDWALFSTLWNEGHYIGSHCDHSTTPMTLVEEYSISQTKIKANIDAKAGDVIGYPWGLAGPPGGPANDRDTAKIYYVGARGVTGGINMIAEIDWFNTKSNPDMNFTPSNEYNSLDNMLHYNPAQSGKYKGFFCQLTHTATAERKANLIYAFDYLTANINDVWVGLYIDVTKYGMQREAASLTATSITSGEIRLTLTDTLDDARYDYPLTVKVRLDSSWTNFTASQGGVPVNKNVQLYNGNLYALIDVIPDRGTIVLSK